MMSCLKCGKGLPDNTAYCDYCGADLLSTPSGTRVSAPAKIDTVEQQSDDVLASAIAHPEAIDLANAITAPRRPMESAVQPSFQTPRSLSAVNVPPAQSPVQEMLARSWPGSATATASVGTVQLQLGKDSFELSGQHSYLLGRRDADQNLFPDVDLQDWNGAACGVSRRHAIIRRQSNAVTIEDLDSRNSTILNGRRLYPHQQYELVNGSEIRLGAITLTVKIVG